jgi:Tachylectin
METSMKWGIWLLVLISGQAALAESPVDVLRQAFKNEDAATHKRIELNYTIDTANFRHVLIRIRPDRVHLGVGSSGGVVQEAIVIGKTLYTRQGTNEWTESPAPAQIALPTHPAAGLEKAFTGLAEGPRRPVNGREQRVFAGNLRWQAGRDFNEGAVEILVDAGLTLPTRIAFTGQCASRPCTLTQTLDFSTSLMVTAPVVPGADAVQLYATTGPGELTWRQHRNPMTGAGPLGSTITFRSDFATRYRTVIAAIGQAVFYAMTPDGDLYWLRHLGYRDGSDRWLGPTKVGNGWTTFDKLIAGENGVIYGRMPDGQLRWYRHLGYLDGSMSWANPQTVGSGWQGFIDIFAGSAGTLYGILPNGDLMWHRHLGHETGAATWIDPSRKVGNGWQGSKVHSAGDGILYVINRDGELHWYRHHGYENGDYNWAVDLTLDRGWDDFKYVFAVRSEQ